ncbi:MAG: hypothetical protein HYV97_15175 [Bdellovibrio sp.]|nr:hypothetical protein [Bdellovibrio sp.]
MQKHFTWASFVFLLLALLPPLYGEDAPPCLSLGGCLRLTLNPRLLGLPPGGDCQDNAFHLPETTLAREEREPSRAGLILMGLGLAPVEFFLSTAIHEGSHAGTIGLFSNVDLTAYKPWPHTTPGGNFVFGAVYWNGSSTPGERALISAAPMITDTAILGTYSALTATGNVPHNKYARMGLWVFAAGHWVDMANHLAARNEFTDSRKLMRYLETEHGLSNTEAMALVKGTQAAVLLTSGYFMARELIDIFKSAPGRKQQPTRTVSSSQSRAFEIRDVYLLPAANGNQVGLVLGGRF